MLKHFITTLGKTVVIVTGVGYGVAKALEAFSPGVPEEQEKELRHESRDTSEEAAAIHRLKTRLDTVEERLIRIEDSLSSLALPDEPVAEPIVVSEEPRFVTHAEMTEALERHSRDLDGDIERRFELQNRAVQSLRTMVARTDELLERVIENIESMTVSA